MEESKIIANLSSEISILLFEKKKKELVRLAQEVGVPPGVVNVIHGSKVILFMLQYIQ